MDHGVERQRAGTGVPRDRVSVPGRPGLDRGEASRRLQRLRAWSGLTGLCGALACTPLAPPTAEEPLVDRAPALPRYVSPGAAADSAYLRGRLLQLEGRWADAFEAFALAASIEPDAAAIQRALARAAMRLGRNDVAARSAERAFELDPDDEDALREYIAALLAVGELDRAAELLEARLDETGDDPDTTLGLLTVYLELGRFERAETLARTLIEQQPGVAPGYLALGSVLERTDRLDEAEAVYRGAFGRVPLDPRLYDGLARVAQRRGDADREIQVLREKLDLVPGEPYTLRRLVEIHSDRGDQGALISTVEEIVYYDPQNDRARFQLGLLYLQAGRADEAIEALGQVARMRPASDEVGSQARYLLGRVYARGGEQQRAIEALQSIPEEAATFGEAQLTLVALFQSDERYTDALATLERLLEHEDNLDFHVQRAQLLQRTGRLEEAVALLERLIGEHPEHVGDLYYQIGMLYTGAGQEDRALEVMVRALEIVGENPNVLNFVGYVWADRGVRLEEAETLIRRAVAQRPADGFIADSLGWVLYKRGLEHRSDGRAAEADALFQGAVQELERAQELLDPDDATIERHLGDVYRTLARDEDALRAYERALGLNPKDEDLAEIESQIDLLRGRLGDADRDGATD